MDQKEIGRIFYRDGYRLASQHLEGKVTVSNLREAIRSLYEAIDGLLDAFLQRSASDGNPAACKKGCSWCCHQEVFAVTHEILYLQDHIQDHTTPNEREAYISRAREKSLLTLNKPVEEQIKVRSPCPFLVDGSCSVYDARPMGCRIYLSSSVKSCEKDYNQPGNKWSIPELYEFPLQAGRMLNEGFVAYLKQIGMGSSEIPLEQGYASVVTLNQTFKDWIG
jgi:Fe-S-cluster containining protein